MDYKLPKGYVDLIEKKYNLTEKIKLKKDIENED